MSRPTCLLAEKGPRVPHVFVAWTVGIASLLPAMGLCGCAGPSGDRGTTREADAGVSGPFAAPRATTSGTYFVKCTPRPSPIPLNEVFSLDVEVYRDAQLKDPASDVRIDVDAGMPAHHHGMTLTPRVARVGDGRFRVEGMLMHMPGAWVVDVDVSTGSATERARFEVEIR